MLWMPGKGTLRVQHNAGSVGSVTPGTTVTTGGTASTKGTPAEVFASTSFDAYWIKIMAMNYAAATTASEGSMDILIGAATEAVLIPDLLMGYCSQFGVSSSAGFKQWEFPLYVPAGSRIAVQAAGARVSTALSVCIYLYGGNGIPPFRVGTRVTTYGMGTVPDGTAITPGASGAEGSWTQITASTSRNHFALLPSFQPTGDTTISDRAFAVDLGIGAATEEMIAESYLYADDSSENMVGPMNSMPCFRDIPSGTRLVMRASNSGSNDGGYNGVIHAVS